MIASIDDQELSNYPVCVNISRHINCETPCPGPAKIVTIVCPPSLNISEIGLILFWVQILLNKPLNLIICSKLTGQKIKIQYFQIFNCQQYFTLEQFYFKTTELNLLMCVAIVSGLTCNLSLNCAVTVEALWQSVTTWKFVIIIITRQMRSWGGRGAGIIVLLSRWCIVRAPA